MKREDEHIDDLRNEFLNAAEKYDVIRIINKYTRWCRLHPEWIALKNDLEVVRATAYQFEK